MGNSLFLVIALGCFCSAMVGAFGLIRDYIKTAKERRGTLRQNENKPGEDPAQDPAEDPAQDPAEDPAQDPAEDPKKNEK